MVKENTKEQLQEKEVEAVEETQPVETEVVVEEVVADETPEDPVSEEIVEDAEDVVVEEQPEAETEEVEDAEPVEEEVLVEETPEVSEDEKEALSKDIKNTKEELSVVKEVREELVSLYSKYNESSKTIEKLSAELKSLKTENGSLSENLSKYVKAEKELSQRLHVERLERLSNKFKILGQNKTVEQLNAMDVNTLKEFENIVDAAIDKAADSKEMLSETVPSNSTVESTDKSDEKLETVVKKDKKPEALSSNEFFAGLCGELKKEQISINRSARKL